MRSRADGARLDDHGQHGNAPGGESTCSRGLPTVTTLERVTVARNSAHGAPPAVLDIRGRRLIHGARVDLDDNDDGSSGSAVRVLRLGDVPTSGGGNVAENAGVRFRCWRRPPGHKPTPYERSREAGRSDRRADSSRQARRLTVPARAPVPTSAIFCGRRVVRAIGVRGRSAPEPPSRTPPTFAFSSARRARRSNAGIDGPAGPVRSSLARRRDPRESSPAAATRSSCAQSIGSGGGPIRRRPRRASWSHRTP